MSEMKKRRNRLGMVAVLWCALVVFAMTFAVPSHAETFAQSQSQMTARLQKSLNELRVARERIAKEKIPLSKRVATLEGKIADLRTRRDQLLKARDSRSIDLTSLRSQVASLGEQDEFVNSRLNEFVREFESRLDISELTTYEARTSAAQLSQKNVSLSAEEKRGAQLAVVEAAIDRIRLQLGGYRYPGEALGPDGVLTQGTFIALGPTVFFASGDQKVTGLVQNQLNAADPVVVSLPGGIDRGIASLTATGRGSLPFDATLGKALRKEKARKSLQQYVADGGAVGLVIICLGLSALGLTAFKTYEIMRFRVAGDDEVSSVLGEIEGGSREGAAKQAAQIEGVVGEMLTTGVRHLGEGRALIEELLFEKILSVRPTLERFLPFLAIVAAASPLLGLLGTVIGMIKTFQLITIFGTGDAKSLSSGISEALVTTALGLIVAIPILILHGALSRMARHKIGLLEQITVAFVNGSEATRARLHGSTNGGK